jgi:hypothetical protein
VIRLVAFCAVACPLVVLCQLAAGTRWAPYVGVAVVVVTLVASFRESRIERDLARWEKRQRDRGAV